MMNALNITLLNRNIQDIGIPKIIHQVWINDTFLGNTKKDVPEKWLKSIELWKEKHPDWTHILWTDDIVLTYLKKLHPYIIDHYKNYEYLIQRADMIRYFILYDYGGVYCDLDMYPLKNIEDMIQCNLNHFVYSSNSDTITNLFMISPRFSPIMKKIQYRILNPKVPFYSLGKHLKVYNTTGPTMLTDVLLNYIKDPYIILPRKYFNPYSIVEDKLIVDNKEEIKEIYLNTIDNSSTWNSFDTYIYNFILKHRSLFITIGISTVLVVIVGLIYYIFKYKKCKESKNKCEELCYISPKSMRSYKIKNF
jgi:mannosyltransferase OCH1-like enzyme